MVIGQPRKRRSIIKILLIVIGYVVAAGILLVIGLYVGERWTIVALSHELDGTQAMLTFNRLIDERRVQSLLSEGCTHAAQKQIDIDEDKGTELLAEIFNDRKLPTWTRKYVSDRDPNLVSTLATFKSKYGSTWEQPDCKNTASWSEHSTSHQ